jgi:hypothetical protein
MRKAQKDQVTWLMNLVRTMMQQLHVREAIMSNKINLNPVEIAQVFATVIYFKLYNEMTAATRGKIADFGLSLAECGPSDLSAGAYVVPSRYGRGIVADVALSVIVNRMYWLLREEQAQREHDSVRDQHDLTGRGSIGHRDLTKDPAWLAQHGTPAARESMYW